MTLIPPEQLLDVLQALTFLPGRVGDSRPRGKPRMALEHRRQGPARLTSHLDIQSFVWTCSRPSSKAPSRACVSTPTTTSHPGAQAMGFLQHLIGLLAPMKPVI